CLSASMVLEILNNMGLLRPCDKAFSASALPILPLPVVGHEPIILTNRIKYKINLSRLKELTGSFKRKLYFRKSEFLND
ncbi:MAG: hypothetical protein WD431_18825, partial [Cyclobacteriaceae bacterium]